MEGQLPAEGFINGLSFPTAADCAVLNITSAYMPMGAAMKMAQYDTSLVKFPKVKALADRTAVAEGIAGNFQLLTPTPTLLACEQEHVTTSESTSDTICEWPLYFYVPRHLQARYRAVVPRGVTRVTVVCANEAAECAVG